MTHHFSSRRFTSFNHTLVRALRRALQRPLLVVALCASASLGADPLLTRVDSHDWILTVKIDASSYPIHRSLNNSKTPGFRTSTSFSIDSAIFVFPMIESSAAHEARPADATSSLSVDGVNYDTSATLLPDYQAGEQLGRWELPKLKGNLMRFQLEVPMTSYSVQFDERRAMQLPWPTEAWSPLVASTLKPQLFVESDDELIQRNVRRWTNNNPGGFRPTNLAKMLAAHVMEDFRSTTDLGYISGRQGGFAGLEVQGAAATARARSGSPTDLATYLCAVYRAAGLPARLVVGYDLAASLGAQLSIPGIHPQCEHNQRTNSGVALPILRTWVEFYLYDQADKRGEWIPVDIYRQFKVSMRPPPLDRPWDFFGTNLCLINVAPISFHLHPPTTVVNAGPPALWGWLPLPSAPVIEQRLDFGAREPTVRSAP